MAIRRDCAGSRAKEYMKKGKPSERAGRKAWGLQRENRHASPAAIYFDLNF